MLAASLYILPTSTYYILLYILLRPDTTVYSIQSAEFCVNFAVKRVKKDDFLNRCGNASQLALLQQFGQSVQSVHDFLRALVHDIVANELSHLLVDASLG